MTIEGFTPISALIGGLFIGTAAVLLLLLNGRIAGISGIAGGLLRPKADDVGWRIMFILGLMIGAGAYGLVTESPIIIEASWPIIIAGGLLVGFGTQMGGGCTSGHGVCGIARLSPRSILATIIFMVAAILTVYITRHVVGA